MQRKRMLLFVRRKIVYFVTQFASKYFKCVFECVHEINSSTNAHIFRAEKKSTDAQVI